MFPRLLSILVKPRNPLCDEVEYPWEKTKWKNTRILILQIALVLISMGIGYCLHWAIGA